MGHCEHELKVLLHPEELEPTSATGTGNEAAAATQPRLLDRRKGMWLLGGLVVVLLISFALRKLLAK